MFFARRGKVVIGLLQKSTQKMMHVLHRPGKLSLYRFLSDSNLNSS